MPRLPRGLTKRKIRNKGSLTTVFVYRALLSNRDVRISLGSDYAVAMAEYHRLKRDGLPQRKPPSVTVEYFSKRWLAEYAASRRSGRGRAQAEQRFRDYLWPSLGSTDLEHLMPADLRRLNAQLEDQEVGLVTRRRMLEDVRCMLRYAVDEAEALDRSPWRRGILPALPETAPRPLNDLELAQAIETAPRSWKLVIRFLAATGLRWGEARALRWEDVRRALIPT
jgi:integrase